MKAKITSVTYYIAETTEGKKFSVDIRNPQIKHAFDNNLEIEGEIFREERQDRYTNGEYSRSYTIIEKFVPKKEKITLGEEPTISLKREVKETVEEVQREPRPRIQPQHIPLPKKEN